MHFSIDRTVHTTAFDKPVVDHWLERKIAQTAAGSTEKDIFSRNLCSHPGQCKISLAPCMYNNRLNGKTFTAADSVTGHARGCAREWACPKLQSMWTRKYSFPFPKTFMSMSSILNLFSQVGKEEKKSTRDLSRIFRKGPMAYGIGENSVILVIFGKVFQATEFMHLCYLFLALISR